MPARVSQDSSGTNVVEEPAEDSPPGDLLQEDFDPVSFLNRSLPSLNLQSTQPFDQSNEKSVSLQDISVRTQAVLAKATAQNVRFTSGLSHLTDEILRSGSRLAYEVELLRGNANALHESLTDSLLEDIQNFTVANVATSERAGGTATEDQPRETVESGEPEFISQLRMLGQVRARLEEVVAVFGEAMKWPLPPSELSITSSLISVSAPDPGPEGQNREEKGKAFAKKVKTEITELLGDKDGGPDLEAATAKIEALRLLSQVWKSTAEERARNKLVDSLAKLAEEKKRQIEARSQAQPRKESDSLGQRSSSTPGRAGTAPSRERGFDESGNGPAGLFRNLQRLRDEIYLD